jgi:hypothetical protein
MAGHGRDGLFDPFARTDEEGKNQIIGPEMGFPDHFPETLVLSQPSQSVLRIPHGRTPLTEKIGSGTGIPFSSVTTYPPLFLKAEIELKKIYNIFNQLSIKVE